MERTVQLNEYKHISLASASVLQIGDSREICSNAQVIAIQREKQLFFSDELKYSDYDIFQKTDHFVPSLERVNMKTTNIQPLIKINKMKVIAASSASIIHIGNSKYVQIESRVKNIRHLNRIKQKE